MLITIRGFSYLESLMACMLLAISILVIENYQAYIVSHLIRELKTAQDAYCLSEISIIRKIPKAYQAQLLESMANYGC